MAPGATLGGLEDAELAARALGVLRANSLGHATAPSPKLYPHQWSWDSACIAMGYAGSDQDCAETELRSLFAGQWRNGLLPHIVFTEGARYFPGPEFWEAERSPDAPARPRTSGIVQPPLHATAAWRVYRHAADRERAAAFVEELFPKLVAWHGYLYRERTRGDEALVETWHPWETGMDNSPLWDDTLARIELATGEIPSYKRIDVELADAAERPTDRDYDRYAYLVQLFRELDYRPEAIRESCPFAIQAVLFNSILVQANRDLAQLARVAGADPEPYDAWGASTAAALEKLWDDELGVYLDFDLRTGEHLRSWSSSGFAPLYAGVPAPDRARQLVERVSSAGLPVGEGGWAATSLPPGDPRFEPALYWRGPVWPILNWVLYQGLTRYGVVELAEQIRRTLLELSRDGGFWEHYNPLTRRGHGGEQFAWTAALVLDLLLPQAADSQLKASD